MGMIKTIKDFVAPFEEVYEEYDEDDGYYNNVKEDKPMKETVKPKVATVVLFEPKTFDDSELIGNELKANKSCIVNLQLIHRETAQRTVDFLTGMVFALDGTIQKIGTNVILCTPNSIGVEGAINNNPDDFF